LGKTVQLPKENKIYENSLQIKTKSQHIIANHSTFLTRS